MRPRLSLVAAGGASDGGAEGGDGGGELLAGVALVADDRLAAAQAPGQQRQRDLAFGAVGWGECRCSRGAVGAAEKVQAHPPEPAGVAARVAVTAAVGELRAAGGVDRSATLDRGRVEQDEVVV